jgi:hypothetical protein
MERLMAGEGRVMGPGGSRHSIDARVERVWLALQPEPSTS